MKTAVESVEGLENVLAGLECEGARLEGASKRWKEEGELLELRLESWKGRWDRALGALESAKGRLVEGVSDDGRA